MSTNKTYMYAMATTQEVDLEGLGHATLTFIHTLAMVDLCRPRQGIQDLTICIVRFAGEVYTASGVAIKSPHENDDPAQGERLAFIRALQSVLFDDLQQASHIARKTLWALRNPQRAEALQHASAASNDAGVDANMQSRLSAICPSVDAGVVSSD